MFALREALIGLRRNGVMTFIAIGIMFFSLFLFGLFLVGTFNLFGIIRVAREKVEINAFLKDELSENRIKELQAEVKSMVGVKDITYINKEEAMNEFREEISNAPSLLEAVKTNPLPPSLKINMDDEYTTPEKVEEVAEKIKIFSEVETVEYGRSWVRKLDNVVKILFLFDALLGIVISLSSIFVVSNTVRLTVLARKKTIEVMKLVGATERTIQAPFIMAGAIEGIIGGGLSAGILYLIYVIAAKFNIQFYFPHNPIIIGMVVMGLLLGIIGSRISVKSTSKEVSLETANI